jgi:hypothetical protein
VVGRQYARGLEVYARLFQIPGEQVASWCAARWRALRRGGDPRSSRRVGRGRVQPATRDVADQCLPMAPRPGHDLLGRA